MVMFLVRHPMVLIFLNLYFSSHVDDFNTRNKVLTAKLLRQGYRYHKLRKAFSKFYRRHFDIVSKYNVGLKTLLLQGLSEPEFYGDLVYKFRKIINKIDFPYHFKKIIVRFKKIGYNINVMRQTACLVVNPIKVNSFYPVISSLAVPRRHFCFGSSWLFFYLFVCGMLAVWPPV